MTTWTFWELRKIENYTTLVVAGEIIEQVPEKYRAEVQTRVDNWFITEAEADSTSSE